MSRLSKLYEAMETLRREGLSLEELEEQVNALEEELIKKEILPIVTRSIAPALKQVQRELVLVVDYVPGVPISVHISRKRNITADIIDAKKILPDVQVEHSEGGRMNPKGYISAPSRMKITFSDGHFIQERTASETLRKFVIEVGVDEVRALGLKLSKVPFISNTLDLKYASEQKPVGNGWYVITHSSTVAKKRLIEVIAKRLKIKLRVEIV